MKHSSTDLRFGFRQMRRSAGLRSHRSPHPGSRNRRQRHRLRRAAGYDPATPSMCREQTGVITFAPHASGYPVFSYPRCVMCAMAVPCSRLLPAEAMQVFGLEADGATEPVWGSEVSGQYFEALGIKPFMGRLLQRSDDDHPGASEAAVISWPA